VNDNRGQGGETPRDCWKQVRQGLRDRGADGIMAAPKWVEAWDLGLGRSPAVGHSLGWMG